MNKLNNTTLNATNTETTTLLAALILPVAVDEERLERLDGLLLGEDGVEVGVKVMVTVSLFEVVTVVVVE
jgi:hypothetical protein